MIKLEYIYRIYKNLLNPVLGTRKLNQTGFSHLHPSIKGRVERDCLNVSQNKTDGGCNVHSAKAGLPAPTSEDISYVLRVIKETGIEKSVDAQPTKDALESYCLSSKMTLKPNLLHLFTCFQL